MIIRSKLLIIELLMKQMIKSRKNYYFREEALREVDVNFVKDKLLNKFRVK